MTKGQARAGAVIGTTVLLAACGGGWVPEGPREFKLGYVDGCQQGYYDGGWQLAAVSDRDKLANDPVYRDGWEQGHAKCYADQLRTPQIIPTGAGMP